ncbi:hypothetical protein [Rhodoblastus sp.]|uniref:hypothetical protein n=1 Tax=Rhodoblastus sp. TaxID=1962975 RepID=UPI0035AF76E1
MALLDFSLPASDPNNPNGVLSSASDIQRRQLMAQALMKQGADYSPVQSPWQGAARMAQAIMGGWEQGQLDREDESSAASRRNALATLIGGNGDSAGQAGNPALADAVSNSGSSSTLPKFAAADPRQLAIGSDRWPRRACWERAIFCRKS